MIRGSTNFGSYENPCGFFDLQTRTQSTRVEEFVDFAPLACSYAEVRRPLRPMPSSEKREGGQAHIVKNEHGASKSTTVPWDLSRCFHVPLVEVLTATYTQTVRRPLMFTAFSLIHNPRALGQEHQTILGT